ncbi:NAD(P)/FAD-dependent oxidoreductase [Rhizorhabdus sp. FW153]|uniref:NAD(P)/FAD-dependent oxidoreductase n=1 Tax=Rhizorhabdus sp. FW153 TaxID=3400216 RepID=UPI003CF8F096
MQPQSLSYWQQSTPPFAGGEQGRVEGDCDVAVIGGGFTGLSAALELARSGANVMLLEGGRIAGAASGRNGGQCNAGTAHDFGALASAHGIDLARKWYLAHVDAVETVERITAREGIDCDFIRCGRAKLAAKPEHFPKLEAAHALLRKEVDPNVQLVGPGEISSEIHAQGFHGALVQTTSAQLHPGKLGAGLGEAAVRAGARVWESAPVEAIERSGARWSLTTPRGRAQARQVLIATGGNSPYAPFGWFRRRIVTVGSFVIATEPLSASLAHHLFPTRRNYVTSRIVGNYFRLTGDNRLIFGGRARFALSNPTSDAKSGRVLEAKLRELFPDLAGTGVAACWGGAIDLTADRLPRAGEHDGLFYAMGYSGHGVQMATAMGQHMARVMGGDPSANPFTELSWPAIPGHLGKPWFLPMVGAWYRLQDWLH